MTEREMVIARLTEVSASLSEVAATLIELAEQLRASRPDGDPQS